MLNCTVTKVKVSIMADMSVESRALSPLSSAAGGSSNKAERPQDQKVMDAVSQVQERTADKVEKQVCIR